MDEPNTTGMEDEVKAFISGKTAGTVERPAGDEGVPLQVSKETLEALQKMGKIVDGPQPTSIGEPLKEIDVPRDSSLIAATQEPIRKLTWEVATPTMGKVAITQLDRDLYFKAVNNDVAVEFQITVHDSLDPVTVRSLSNFETDAVYRAVALDQEEEAGKSTAINAGLTLLSHINNKLQNYAVCLHLVTMPGKRIPELRFEEGRLPSLDDAANQIRERYKTLFTTMHPPRYHMLLNAIRLFDVKLQYCNNAFANGGFTNPADIA